MCYIEGIADIGYIYFNINFDISNSTFDFQMLNKQEFTELINSEIPIYTKKIEKNNYNAVPYTHLSDESVIEKYFLDYIRSAVDFPEVAYNNLDETYKNARFGSLDEFKKYVSNNSELKDIYESKFTNFLDYESYIDYWTSIKHVGIKSYNKEKFDDYTRYICIDSYDNYYIFYVTSMMQYTLILDTYTIDLSEFTEKYNTANNQEKVILNLNKINLSLNSGDYKYVYSKLADSYKNNTFPTLSSFETYARVTFYTKNQFEYITYEAEGETYYTYEVEITDKTQQNSDIINKTFIMQLRRRY